MSDNLANSGIPEFESSRAVFSLRFNIGVFIISYLDNTELNLTASAAQGPLTGLAYLFQHPKVDKVGIPQTGELASSDI